MSDNEPPSDNGASAPTSRSPTRCPACSASPPGVWIRTGVWALETSVRVGARLARASTSPRPPPSWSRRSAPGSATTPASCSASADLDDRVRQLMPPRPTGPSRATARSLREQGAELLRQSADVDAEDGAHPAYARILSELAPDEARILRLLMIARPAAVRRRPRREPDRRRLPAGRAGADDDRDRGRLPPPRSGAGVPQQSAAARADRDLERAARRTRCATRCSRPSPTRPRRSSWPGGVKTVHHKIEMTPFGTRLLRGLPAARGFGGVRRERHAAGPARDRQRRFVISDAVAVGATSDARSAQQRTLERATPGPRGPAETVPRRTR